tara:strand:- start:767 stop:877 length:111 start_codon:yes stop_codon:yes gene_type:complete
MAGGTSRRLQCLHDLNRENTELKKLLAVQMLKSKAQ